MPKFKLIINPQHMCTPVARLATIIPGSLTIRTIGGAPYLGLKIGMGGDFELSIDHQRWERACMYVT